MRQTNWSDNSTITIFVLPSQHDLHKSFSKTRLEIFPYQLDRIWNKLTYSGLGVAPTVVKSPEALIQAVLSTPGSIGYADEQLIKPFMQNNTKMQGDAEQSSSGTSLIDNASPIEKISVKGVVHVVTIKD